MPLYSLTKEKIEDLQAKIREKQQQIDELSKLTIEDLWIRELDRFEESYRKDLRARGLSAG